MINRNCTYTFTMEIEGNQVKKEGLPGITRSEIYQKQGKEKSYSCIWVEDSETGELREAFAYTVKLAK